MAHMEIQYVQDLWLEVEGDGTEFVLLSDTELIDFRQVHLGWSVTPKDLGFEQVVNILKDYLSMSSSKVVQVSCRKGCGVRLSAPGYLDCTEWAVFRTKTEAKYYAKEYLMTIV
jgi:hypothetical protein